MGRLPRGKVTVLGGGARVHGCSAMGRRPCTWGGGHAGRRCSAARVLEDGEVAVRGAQGWGGGAQPSWVLGDVGGGVGVKIRQPDDALENNGAFGLREILAEWSAGYIQGPLL